MKITNTFDYERFDAVINLRTTISRLGEATLPAPGLDAVWPKLIVVDLRAIEADGEAARPHRELPAYESDPDRLRLIGLRGDRIADDRDRRAAEEDRASDARDERANARDMRADVREHERTRSDQQTEADRARSKMDRREAADDRNHARCQRKAAAKDRYCAAQERNVSTASRT